LRPAEIKDTYKNQGRVKMSDLEGWSRVVEDDNDQEEEEVNLKLKKISLCHSGN